MFLRTCLIAFAALLLCLLFAQGQVLAAWSFVQDKQEQTGSGTSANLTFTSAVVSGDIVCGTVFYTGQTTNVISSIVDDKSNNYTVVNFGSGGGSFGFAVFWSGGALTNGPSTITVNTSASTTNLWITIDEFGPSAGTLALDGNATANSNTSSGNFTTAVAHDLIYSGIVDSTTTAVGSGFTGAQALSSFNSEYNLDSGAAGTQAGTWTSTGGAQIGAFAVSAVVTGVCMLALLGVGC